MNKLAPLLFTLIGLLIGFAAAKLTTPDDGQSADARQPATAQHTADDAPQGDEPDAGHGHAAHGNPSGDDAQSDIVREPQRYKHLSLVERATMIDDLENYASFEQLVNVVDMLAGMSTDELVELGKYCKLNASSKHGPAPFFIGMAIASKDTEAAIELDMEFGILESWSTSDVEGFIAMQQRLKGNTSTNVGYFQERLIKEDPATAFAYRSYFSNHNEPRYADLAQSWASKDPDAAWAALTELGYGQAQRDFINGYFKGLYKYSPERAFSELGTIENPVTYKSALDRLADFISDDTPEGMDAFLSNFGSQLDDERIEKLIRKSHDQIIAKDPLRAIELLPQITSQATGKDRDQLYYNIVQSYALHDFDAAMNWAQGIPGEDGDQAMLGALEYLVQNNPSQAAGVLANYQDKPYYNELIAKYIQHSAKTDPASAASAYIANGLDNKKLLSNTVDYWLNNDPQAALQFVNGLGDDDLNKVCKATAQNLAYNDLQMGLDWTQSMAGTSQYPDIVDGLMDKWVDYDTQAAAEWANQLPAGEARDKASLHVAWSIYKDTPILALEWAQDTTGKGTDNLVNRITQQLNKMDDLPATLAEIEAADLNDEFKAKVLEKLMPPEENP